MRTRLKEHAAAEVEKLQQIADSYRVSTGHVYLGDFQELCASVKALWMRLAALEENTCSNRSDG